ncbi:extracellular ligand-binding receptor [Tolypothrix tenuis PCC 7101]|uniref:Extracellular ligand-binding receptor n=1 Tax=Tolypothrix tenuis PCC 7101 TaxID=231146 RepID=A0A1Z4MS26_9CYAN|nr:ABC transporter substrate-binding protein [Aulosira sp. FACHB-113]BAY96219.1 extracellular ligand-binding receptor [Tolypothrix tenuis PCC 7101]BAZ73274.1 extracellular ligand-binding receptor [Aulosira laxa NIES-50]
MAKINRSLAIVIGIDKYTHIPTLKNAVADAQEIASVLQKNYGYEVLLLLNQRATKEKLDQLVSNLKNKIIEFDSQSIQVKPTDRVLFYFAGHGFAEEAQDSEDGRPAGYFMPQDADDGNSNTWLSMQKLYAAFSSLDCHHLLMILDCCFAGRISWVGKGRNAARSRKLYQQSYEHFIKHQTQQIITSAAYDEKAQDSFRFGQRGDIHGHSPFAYLLLKILQGNSDGGKDKFIEAILEDKVITVHELFTYLQNQLGKIAQGQTPALSQPRKYDQKTGEYVFLKGEYLFPLHNFNLQDLIPLKLDENTNPYKGLASFEKEDSQLFFGRKRLIEEPKAGLHTKVSNHPLTVVLGTSGSGKSSLVKAGLIPALKLAEASGQQQWVILDPMRPGESPLNALNKILPQSGSASFTILNLNYQEKSKVIYNKINDLITNNSQLLLVVDQAEELFTLCQNQEERTDFINLLAQLLNNYQQQLRIVLTLRSEFEPQIRDAINETHWQKLWKDGRFIVTPMNREELQQVIEEPAAQRALFFESPKLVNDLIDEVVQMPGALPLLSFTLSELYLKYLKAEENLERNDRTITEADYQDIGGVTRSLTQTADKTYDKLVQEQVDEQTKKAYELTIRDVMLRMVAISGGELARRRVLTSELEYPEPKNEQAKKVIDRFIEARLLVKGVDAEGQKYVEGQEYVEGQKYVEPVHDALIIGWAKIKYWLDEKQEIVKQKSGWNPIKNLLIASKIPLPLTSKKNSGKSDRPEAEKQLKVNLPLQREVNTSANNWRSKKNTDGNRKAVGFFWNADPRLDLLKQVLNSENNWLNKVEAEFVQRSVERKVFNTRRNWSIAIAVMLGLGTGLVFSLIGQRNALIGQIKATGQSAESNLPNQELNALLESLRAGKSLKDWPGYLSLFKPESKLPFLKPDSELQLQVLQTLRKIFYVAKERNRVEVPPDFKKMFFTPDGTLLIATAGNDGIVHLQNLKGEKLPKVFSGHKDEVKLDVDRDGRSLATIDQQGTVRLWNLEGKLEEPPKLVASIPQSSYSNVYERGIIFSPDGKKLVAYVNGELKSDTSLPHTVYLWDLSGNEPKLLKKDQRIFSSISFNTKNQLIVATDESNDTLRLSNFMSGEKVAEFKEFSGTLFGNLVFSPDGTNLAAYLGADLSTAYFGSLDDKSWREFKPINRASSIIFNARGDLIIGQEGDGIIGVYNPSLIKDSFSNGLKFELKGHQGSIREVISSSNGSKFASRGNDNTIRLWEINNKPVAELSKIPNLISISISPDGKQLAVVESDGTVRLLDLNAKELKRFVDFQGIISQLIFSPDGQQLAAVGKDNRIRLLDLNEKDLYKSPTFEKTISQFIFRPDGQQLAVVENDGTIHLLNLNNKTWKTLPDKVSPKHDGTSRIAFGSDGKLLVVNSPSTDSNPADANDITLSELKAAKGKELVKFKGAVRTFNSIGLNTQGNLFASADMVDDSNPIPDIHIWDMSGRLLTTFKDQRQGKITNISLSADGNLMATLGKDGTAKLWRIGGLDELIEQGCNWVSDYLATLDENNSDRKLCEGISEPEKHGEISMGDKTLVPTLTSFNKQAGVEAISNGDFDTTIKHLQAYLKNTPNDPEALIYLNNARIKTQKSYTIAISAPIGSDVNGALEMLRGVAQAQNEINQAGGINKVPLRVLIADDDNKADTAKKIAEELVKNPDVIGVVGHYASDVSLAAGEVYQAGKLTAISPVSTSVKLTGFGNYIFRTVPSDSVAAKALADYMRSKLGKKNAAVFYNSKSDYSESLKLEFVKFLSQEGGQVSKDLVFNLSDPNFNAAQSVEKSIENGAEVLVLLPNSEKLDDTMQVVKANNQRLPILGGDDVYAPKTLQIGAADANGMIVAVPWHILASDPNFRATSRRRWKADVNWRTAMSYDATIALITALQQNPTREGLAQTLRSQDFVAKGATGEVKFDAKGDRSNRGIQLVKIQANPQSRSKYGYDFEPVP